MRNGSLAAWARSLLWRWLLDVVVRRLRLVLRTVLLGRGGRAVPRRLVRPDVLGTLFVVEISHSSNSRRARELVRRHG